MTRPARTLEQVPTVQISFESIMRTEAFRQGVADVRNRRAPRFDGKEFVLMPLEEPEQPAGDDDFINRQWDYERGRQFGVIAPRNLSVMMPCGKRLNPAAVKFYWMHRRAMP
jgi:hypothetical protein